MNWILFKLWGPRADKLAPLDPVEVAKAEAYMRRRQNDVMAGRFHDPYKRFDAGSFITAMQILPPAIGRMAIVDAQRKRRALR